MRVALCFYGQPRYIENTYTWLSHKYHIIDKYNADVFAHTWINNKEEKFIVSDWVDKNSIDIENLNASNIILKRYKPKKYIFEESKTFELNDITREVIKEKEISYELNYEGDFHYSLNNENNLLSHLYSISKVIELLKDEKKYDFVILSRYDNYIKSIPNLYQLDNSKLYLDNNSPFTFSDILMIGGQENIEAFNCINNICELCKNILYFTPDEFKRIAYQKKFNNFVPKPDVYNYIHGEEIRIPFDVSIVKTNTLEKLQK